MVRVLLFFFKRRLLGLFLLLLLVVAAFTQVGNISVQLSLTRFMRVHADSHNQKTRSSNATSSGVDNDHAVGTKEYVPVIFYIYAKHDDILSTDYLLSMQALTTKIMQMFPDAKITSMLTSSILTLNKVAADDDPLLMLDTLVNETPPLSNYEIINRKLILKPRLTSEEKDNLKSLIYHANPVLKDLIDPGLKVSTLVVRFRRSGEGLLKNSEEYHKLVKLVEEHSSQFKKIEYYSYLTVTHAENQVLKNELPLIIALSIAFLCLIASLLTGSWVYGVIIILLAIINLLFFVFFLGITKITFNMMCFLLPILVVVVGSTESIHLLCSFSKGLRKYRGSRVRAAVFMINDVAKACIFTAGTTAVGLYSFLLSGSVALKEYALIGGSTLLVSGITTLFFLPLFLSFFPHKVASSHNSSSFVQDLLARVKCATLSLLHRNTKWLLAFLAFLFIVATFFIVTKMSVDLDFGYVFVNSHPVSVKRKHFIDKYGGYSLIIATVIPQQSVDFFTSENILKVGRLRAALLKLPFVDGVKTYTNTLTSLLNQHESRTYKTITDFSTILNDYSTLRGSVNDSILENEHINKNQFQVLIRYAPTTSVQMKEYQKILRHTISGIMGVGYNVHLNFDYMKYFAISDKLLEEGLISCALCIAVLFLLFIIEFRSFSAGFFALLPSCFTMVALGGVLSASGIPLNAGTLSSFIVVLAVGVDFTIHLFMRHKCLSSQIREREVLSRAVFSDLLAPLLVSAICVCATLLFCLLSTYKQLIWLSVLVGAGVLLAFFINVLFCAVIFCRISPKTLYR